MSDRDPERCPLCQREPRGLSRTIPDRGPGSPRILAALGICVDCLREHLPEARRWLGTARAESRKAFGLPGAVPDHWGGVRCELCSNECVIGEGESGFCGLRTARGGRLVHQAGTPSRGLLTWYRDPLPTNCVAAWVCEGSRHPGHHNLAVFYQSCTADCLFCQNWHFREVDPSTAETTSARELASAANSHTFCVCFFGGDPSSQMPHALAAARYLAERGVRVCWETNGMMHPKLLDRAVDYSISTGGCIKFDLKAFDEELHLALTGVSNRQVKENFARAAKRSGGHRGRPLVIASTLLVPYTVDAEQVGRIADFIAELDPAIPYSLLAFAPSFLASDLPCTSTAHARDAESAARAAGLLDVRVGNRHLLDLGSYG